MYLILYVLGTTTIMGEYEDGKNIEISVEKETNLVLSIEFALLGYKHPSGELACLSPYFLQIMKMRFLLTRLVLDCDT